MKKTATAFAVLGAFCMVAMLTWSVYRVGCALIDNKKQGVSIREAIKR